MEALVIRGARPLEDPRCTWVMGALLARVRSKRIWAVETGGVYIHEARRRVIDSEEDG